MKYRSLSLFPNIHTRKEIWKLAGTVEKAQQRSDTISFREVSVAFPTWVRALKPRQQDVAFVLAKFF